MSGGISIDSEGAGSTPAAESPTTTIPRTSCGRPSRSAASVELALGDEGPDPGRGHDLVSPRRRTRDAPARPRSRRLCPSPATRRRCPCRSWPKWKSTPDHDDAGAELGRRAPRSRSPRPLSLARSASKRRTRIWSTPVASSSSSFWSRSVRRGRRRGRIDHRRRGSCRRSRRRCAARLGCPPAHLVDHPAMTDVHAVVGPDGDGAAVVVSHRGGTLLVAALTTRHRRRRRHPAGARRRA